MLLVRQIDLTACMRADMMRAYGRISERLRIEEVRIFQIGQRVCDTDAVYQYECRHGKRRDKTQGGVEVVKVSSDLAHERDVPNRWQRHHSRGE
jgi:hypothetical protein